jgi:acetylornithine/N-succinyldiaminopimelate aminotransferase
MTDAKKKTDNRKKTQSGVRNTGRLDTVALEDRYYAPFFDRKEKLSIERGKGVWVWDEAGKKYLDFTSGWGVTSIGHAHPVITQALIAQSRKIIQNPNAGVTYSPVRAQLLARMRTILPRDLTRIFFANSGAEANDAVIKLARKVKKRLNVVSAFMSFHGRTISTVSATGQEIHRNKYNPLMPNYRFVPFNDIEALAGAMTDDVAAVILEPIQGEGGVRVPDADYLERVSQLCIKNDCALIIDEIQTGFCRTGPMFASDRSAIKIDFMTMGKGIAGGFPFAAFAFSEEIASKIEYGDHGGTYCGNPLGCAVADAVIAYLIDHRISAHVESVGNATLDALRDWQRLYPGAITDVRGRGLLLALEFSSKETVDRIATECLRNGLILNVKHGTIIRIFPALTITEEEMGRGLSVLRRAMETALAGEKTGSLMNVGHMR